MKNTGFHHSLYLVFKNYRHLDMLTWIAKKAGADPDDINLQLKLW